MPSIIPSIPIDLDRRRHLRFDRTAVFSSEVELRRIWGRDMTFYEAMRGLALVLVEGDLSRLSLNNMAALLVCGLRHEAPMLTLADVQEMLPYNDPTALLPIVASILEAWQAQTPPQTPAEASESSDPLGGSTGNTFGPLSAPASA